MTREWLAEELGKISDKQDKMQDVLVRNTAILDEHIRRTNLLEAEVKPIKKHVDIVQGSSKVAIAMFGLLATLKSLGIF